MPINWAPDVGAPAVVAGINIASRTGLPDYHDTIIYGVALLGYVAAAMDWGGAFIKQMGVAAAPLALDKLYERFKGTPVASRPPIAFKRAPVTRYPAEPAYSEARGVRLV